MRVSILLATLFIGGYQITQTYGLAVGNVPSARTASCITNSVTYPYPSNNSFYYYCYNGELLLVECPVGFVYNQNQNTCSQNSTTGDTSTVSCTSGTNTMYADPSGNCQNYVLCLNGVASQQKCPTGYYFEPNSLSCGTMIPTNCKGSTGTCSEEGEIQAVTNNCQVYNYCTSGAWTVQNCPTGYYYSADRQTCGPTMPSSCSS